jgi:hypothetical protein
LGHDRYVPSRPRGEQRPGDYQPLGGARSRDQAFDLGALYLRRPWFALSDTIATLATPKAVIEVAARHDSWLEAPRRRSRRL